MTSVPLGLSLLLSGSPGAPADAGETARSMPAAAESTLKCLAAKDLCVTHGAVSWSSPGRFSISDPEVRAVSTLGPSRAAELRFKYLGRTIGTRPLASGQVRLQAGLKLRARDGCNVVYVMWRFEPKNELVVSIKNNPGKSNHAQCGARGYTNIPAQRSAPVPPIALGESHRLRAVLADNTDALQVFIDDALVWGGSLGPTALTFDGPIGLRTDTVRLEAELCQSSLATQIPAAPLRCVKGESD